MIVAGLTALYGWAEFSRKKYQEKKNASFYKYMSYAFLILGIVAILYTVLRWKKM